MAATSTVAKLAAVVPLLIIIILPCVLPAGASRMVSPQVPENVLDDDDNAPTTTTTTTSSTFLPIRGGVVMVNNKTARAEDDCSVGCNDESCQKDYPNLCGPDSDPNYCWVGCFCTRDSGEMYNYCTCLCTA